jgi:hypothetical protein
MNPAQTIFEAFLGAAVFLAVLAGAAGVASVVLMIAARSLLRVLDDGDSE